MLPLFKKLLTPTRRRRRSNYYNTTRNARCKAGYSKAYVCRKKTGCSGSCGKKPRKKKSLAATGMLANEKYTFTGKPGGKVLMGRAGRWKSAGTDDVVLTATQSSMSSSFGTSNDMFSQSGCNNILI